MLKSISKISGRISSKINRKTKRQHSGQIIALGGGGFSDQPDNLLLDEYILLQTNKAKPKVLFLPTAGGDHSEYIEKFYRAYKKFNCVPTHLALSKKTLPFKRLERIVMSQDMIFVGGGSPAFLMQVWRKTGLDRIIKKAWKEGIVLSGMSAGAICWYEDGFKNPKDDLWRRIKCLGFLEGSFCPHYNIQDELRKAYRKMVQSGEIEAGYGVQDGVALHYIGTELKYTVSGIPGAKASYVRKSGYRVTEKEIKATYLGIINEMHIVQTHTEKPHSIYETSEQQQSEKIQPEQVQPEQVQPVALTGKSTEIVNDYIKSINSHDINRLLELTCDDAEFIDSMGIDTKGKYEMQNAWNVLWTFFPDYTVQVKEVICKNGTVAVFGTAKGTLATDGRMLQENKFEIPASWTATVTDGKISKWRVYADNQPVRKLIEKYKNKN